MNIEDVVLYHKRYRGSKIAFNSRKGVGVVVEGIVIQISKIPGVVLLRDYENFLHCVSLLTLEEV